MVLPPLPKFVAECGESGAVHKDCDVGLFAAEICLMNIGLQS